MAFDWAQSIDNLVNTAGDVAIARLATPSAPVSTSVGGTPYVEGKPADFMASIPKGYVLIAVAGFAALIIYAATR